MRQQSMSKEIIEKAIEFHGHSCPGIATGIRVAELALRELNPASDGDIVAVAETDMCPVDAIQYLTGCTFGKGNFIHLDYGKNAFNFYRRTDSKGLRIVTKPDAMGDPGGVFTTLRKKKMENSLTPEEQKQFGEMQEARIKKIMEVDLEELFDILPAREPIPPDVIRVMGSLTCGECGELTMKTRTRQSQGQTLCIPCFEAKGNRQ